MLTIQQYNFTFEDIMLKRDLESIKCFTNPFYELNFGAKRNALSISKKYKTTVDNIQFL